MNSVQIKLYDLFRKELHLSTKEDIRLLRDSIHLLELKVEQSKGDIYKAMFWTGIVQLMAILGGVLAIVKYIT